MIVSRAGVDPKNESMAIFYVSHSVSAMWGAVVALGGFMMRSLRSRASVITASIVALLPCNACCILGIPVAVWALITVSQPEVKDAFQ